MGHWGQLSNSDRRIAMTNLVSSADETELTEEVAFVRRLVRLKGQCHMLALRLCRSDGGLQVHSSTRDLLADVIPAGVVATQQIQILCWEEKRDLLQQMLDESSSSAAPMVSSLPSGILAAPAAAVTSSPQPAAISTSLPSATPSPPSPKDRTRKRKRNARLQSPDITGACEAGIAYRKVEGLTQSEILAKADEIVRRAASDPIPPPPAGSCELRMRLTDGQADPAHFWRVGVAANIVFGRALSQADIIEVYASLHPSLTGFRHWMRCVNRRFSGALMWAAAGVSPPRNRTLRVDTYSRSGRMHGATFTRRSPLGSWRLPTSRHQATSCARP